MIRANPEKFDLIDQRKIASQPTWAHLALTDDEIIVSQLQALVTFKWQDR